MDLLNPRTEVDGHRVDTGHSYECAAADFVVSIGFLSLLVRFTSCCVSVALLALLHIRAHGAILVDSPICALVNTDGPYREDVSAG